MRNDDAGMAVEVFVQQAYNRMFPNKIDRHNPLVAWADYRVAGNETNFVETKAQLLTTLSGLQHELHHDRGSNNVEWLNAFGDVEDELRASRNLTVMANAVRKASELLSQMGIGR